ncbi:hypothetical protein EVA_08520 [gut metagenome]|uniref:Uncharacterized protein n=1 Tax=gut metagenome TaxID=749906 RepID=J9GSW0_9ZZZZ
MSKRIDRESQAKRDGSDAGRYLITVIEKGVSGCAFVKLDCWGGRPPFRFTKR